MLVDCHLPPLTVKKISVIFVAALRGDGSKENPVRTAHFYYNDAGELLACYDPINGEPDYFITAKKLVKHPRLKKRKISTNLL